MTILKTRDGTEIWYKDWGSGRPVVLSHGWPLNADSWEVQMVFLAERGYRCIAHDRRGFGRSGQPWHGYDYDTFAGDLAQLLEALEIEAATLVGFSMGGGEVARYLGRYGSRRVAGVVLIAAVPPLMLRTPTNPNGVERSVFDGIRNGVRADRAQFFKDLAPTFFGAGREGAEVSSGTLDWFWLMAMQASLKGTLDCIEAFSATDFTADLESIDVSTLVIHGDADEVVPIAISGEASARIVKDARLEIYPGGAHGLLTTHQDRINRDLLAFLEG